MQSSPWGAKETRQVSNGHRGSVPPRLECGRTSPQSRRHLSMIAFASARERNHSDLRHWSRNFAVEALGDAILPGLAFALERAVPGDVQPIVPCSRRRSDLQGS